MTRTANKTRQKERPEDPVEIDFELDMRHIPEDFLQADICTSTSRSLIFATSDQLQLLNKAKNWYVDGTFKVVRKLFMQLFTINAFVKSGEYAKQVPLLFVLMSRRKKKDYKKVLTHPCSYIHAIPLCFILKEFRYTFMSN